MEKFQVIKNGIVFELQSELEGGFTISIPSFPGCISYGKTIEEALEQIKDALKGCVQVAKENHLDVPEEIEKNLLVTS